MKYLFTLLALFFTPQLASAQCYQNGIPCAPTKTSGDGDAATLPATTLIMGADSTDDANRVPIMTDHNGRLITTVNSMPALPTGANTIGAISNTHFSVNQNGEWNVGVTGPVSVTGDFYQATQPVSQFGTWSTSLTGKLPGFATTPTVNLGTVGGLALDSTVQDVTSALGSPFQVGGAISNTQFGATQSGVWNIGSVTSITNPVAVTGTFFQATQPVSAATLPLPTGAATDASVNSLKTAIGTPLQNGGTIGNTSFGISGTLPAFASTPSVNINSAPALQTYDNGFVTTTAPIYPTNAYRALSLTTTGNLRVDGSSVTQPISGTVTANLGSVSGLALDTSVTALFKSGQLIGNTSFGSVGSSGGVYQQGTGAATANSVNVNIGGQAAPLNVNATLTGGSMAVTNAGTFAVQNTAPLPAGTNTIGAVTVSGSVPVTGTFYQATQPVSAASLPLPSGAATSALQTSMGATLSTIATNTTGGATAANQTTMDAKLASVVTNTTGAATAANQSTSNGYLATIAANSGQAAGNSVWTNSGTISALNGAFELVANGSGSAVLSVSTTNFVGTLSVYGCADASCTVLSNRLLFRSGIGSTGTNTITLNGTTINREYRIVGGGNRFRVVATAYTSGSVSLVATAQSASNIVFVNGPIHTAEEEAIRQGRGYTASTGVVAVAANNYLNSKLCNPAGSGINMFVTLRKYNSNIASGQSPLEFQTFANPTSVPGTNGVIANRMSGGAASAATFQYQMMTTVFAGGTAGASGFVATGGEGDSVYVQMVLTPGQCTAVSIGGAGGGLAATARISTSFVWYEELIN